MAADSQHRRYIIMPKHGFRHQALAADTFKPAGRAVTLTARAATASLGKPQMQVLDSIYDRRTEARQHAAGSGAEPAPERTRT